MAVETALLVGSAALSLAAQHIFKPDSKNPAPSDYPETLSDRGSVLQYVIGRDRVGPLVG